MTVEVRIIEGPLEPIRADWRPAGSGAVVWFEGIVRACEGNESIVALDYQVYEPMAGRMLGKLAEEMVKVHQLNSIVVEHSRGRVPAGLCSFRLRIASRHRKAAILAMDQFIDRMKQDVPIWKSAILDKGGAA